MAKKAIDIIKELVPSKEITGPLDDAASVLELGKALKIARRDHLNNIRILEVEEFIAELFERFAANTETNKEVIKKLEKAKSIAQALGYTVVSSKERKAGFFKDIIKLGKILEHLGNHWIPILIPLIVNKMPPNFWG